MIIDDITSVYTINNKGNSMDDSFLICCCHLICSDCFTQWNKINNACSV